MAERAGRAHVRACPPRRGMSHGAGEVRPRSAGARDGGASGPRLRSNWSAAEGDEPGRGRGASEERESQGRRSATGCSERSQDGGASGPRARAGSSPSAAPERAPDWPGRETPRPDGTILRRARIDDVPGIASVMADFVIQGTLLPRPSSELYQCVREFHVAEHGGRIVACAALRLLWGDLGEVRSLAVHPEFHGKGLGAALVERLVEDARTLELPRIIALTREVPFFERCGFVTASRELLP